MPCSRVFLGWDGPFLPRVVSWMHEAHRREGLADFSSLLVVVPGRRAGRRLLELLAQPAAQPTRRLVPPTIVTVGALPETLGLDSRLAAASEVDETLARVAALRSAPAEEIEALCGRQPALAGLDEWLELCRDLAALEDELASEGLETTAVLRRTTLEEHEQRRWRALGGLGAAMEERLRRRGLATRNRVRLDAPPAASDRLVVLAGVADLGLLFRRLLGGCEVVALVQAPPAEEASFDDWGCPREEAWRNRQLDLRSFAGRVEHVIVDRPGDQVREAVAFAAACCAPERPRSHRFRVDEVSIGVGDRSSARPTADALAASGLASHLAFGRPLARSRPARLLAALGRFCAGRRLADLAALARHPDVPRFLDRSLNVSPPRDETRGELDRALELGDWSTLLDRYITSTLARRLGPELPEQAPGTAVVRQLGEALLDLLPEGRRPLAGWSRPLLDVLATFYGDLTLVLDDPAEAELGESLTLIAEALREQVEAVAARSDEVVFDRTQAVAFTLGRLGAVELGGGHAGDGAIEILGWLELALDDAPALVVTGLNEGTIPQSVSADLFLPDRTRRALGLLHNRRRYARDLFHLAALVHSRERLLLVSGRRSADDEPLAPSRLTLACSDEELPARVAAFFQRARSSPPEAAADVEGWRGEPPRPEPLHRPLTELSVTAFRDYLACPYRFYLRHVLGLGQVRDRGRELDAGGFGRLAHEILRRFGCEPPSDDASAVRSLLRRLVESVAGERFGASPPPALRLQLEQLDRRLGPFASWQAEQVRAGWRIDRCTLEVPLHTSLEVDGEPFRVTGRIDRIDRHGSGRVRLLDYKTGERRRSPHEVHRGDDGEWIDLQLPLYALLAREVGIDAIGGEVELGFVHLSRELEGEVLGSASWSREEVEEAWEVAREVVRGVRAARFWPPAESPPYDDGLGWICGDPLPGARR